MTVLELMERVGVQDTGKAIAYLKDALEEINTIAETHIKTARIDITMIYLMKYCRLKR